MRHVTPLKLNSVFVKGRRLRNALLTKINQPSIIPVKITLRSIRESVCHPTYAGRWGGVETLSFHSNGGESAVYVSRLLNLQFASSDFGGATQYKAARSKSKLVTPIHSRRGLMLMWMIRSDASGSNSRMISSNITSRQTPANWIASVVPINASYKVYDSSLSLVYPLSLSRITQLI